MNGHFSMEPIFFFCSDLTRMFDEHGSMLWIPTAVL